MRIKEYVLNELKRLLAELVDAGFSVDEALETLSESGYTAPGYEDLYDWYYGDQYPDPESIIPPAFLGTITGIQLPKEESMSTTSVTDVVFEQTVMRLDEAMQKATTPAEALDALAQAGLAYSVSQAPEAQVSSIKGDYNKPLEGGSVMRATMNDGMVQYTIMKDSLIGRDMWVRLSAN